MVHSPLLSGSDYLEFESHPLASDVELIGTLFVIIYPWIFLVRLSSFRSDLCIDGGFAAGSFCKHIVASTAIFPTVFESILKIQPGQKDRRAAAKSRERFDLEGCCLECASLPAHPSSFQFCIIIGILTPSHSLTRTHHRFIPLHFVQIASNIYIVYHAIFVFRSV
jgi:hypothetical protein